MSATFDNQFRGSSRPKSVRPSERSTRPAPFGSASTRPPVAAIPTLPSANATTSVATTAVDEANWFGTHDHALAEEVAGRSMAALVGRIIGAKPFPISARRLADLTRMDVVRIEPVIQVLESDPGLSARLLRLVNSAGYALRQRCTSVRHAATLVGTDRLHQIATTAAVLDLFDSKGPIAAQIIEHSTVVGAFCRYLGAHLALPVDDLFTAGFLHDIGKLMLMETEGEQYIELLTRCASRADTIHHLERSAYGFDHAALAAHVLTAWNIPDPVPKIVGWHHEPALAYKHSSLMASLVQTVRLADTLVCTIRESGQQGDFKHLAQHEAARYLEISEPQLAAMWSELRVLYDECHQQCLGENAPALDPRSLRPRQPIALTLDPSPGERASERAHELPKQFPCVECGCPTFGNTCPACGGCVCPDHQVGSNEWCAICARDYQAQNESLPAPMHTKWAVAALGAAVSLSCVLGMLTAGGAGALRAAFGTLMLGLLAALLYWVGRTWLIRKHFVRSRPNRSITEAQLNDGGTLSLVPSMQPDSEQDEATSQSVNWLKANIHLVEPLKEITIREISGGKVNDGAAAPLPPNASVAEPEPAPPPSEAYPSSTIDPVRVQLQSESLVTLPAPAHTDTPAHADKWEQSSEVIAVAQPIGTDNAAPADQVGLPQPQDSSRTALPACTGTDESPGQTSEASGGRTSHHPLAALGIQSQPPREMPNPTQHGSSLENRAVEPPQLREPTSPERSGSQPPVNAVDQLSPSPNANPVDPDLVLKALAGDLAARFGSDFESQVRELAARRVAEMIADRFMAAFDGKSLATQPLPFAADMPANNGPKAAPKPRKRRRQD